VRGKKEECNIQGCNHSGGEQGALTHFRSPKEDVLEDDSSAALFSSFISLTLLSSKLFIPAWVHHSTSPKITLPEICAVVHGSLL